MTKSHYLKIFKSQYLVEFLRYGYNFLHVIITFIGFKITFSNIRSHGAPLLISKGWGLAPPLPPPHPPMLGSPAAGQIKCQLKSILA